VGTNIERDRETAPWEGDSVSKKGKSAWGKKGFTPASKGAGEVEGKQERPQEMPSKRAGKSAKSRIHRRKKTEAKGVFLGNSEEKLPREEERDRENSRRKGATGKGWIS